MRVGLAVIALTVIALAALGSSPALAQSLMSPGDLAAAHASIDGDDHCTKCHQSGKQVVAQRCLDCHKELAGQLAAGAGLHGREYRGKACELCHVEHIGRGAKLVRWPGGAMDKLDHGLTGWPLEGDHGAVACLDCHKKKTPLGRPQFVPTSRKCDSCHKDPHQGEFGGDCRSCHNLTDFKEFSRERFDHKLTRYPLTGKHQQVTCDDCHGTPAKWKPLPFATCDACHRDPHRGEFAPKKCSACHDTKGWSAAAGKMRGNHPGLSLANGHKRVKCETCHDRGVSRAPAKGKACVSCHKNVHEAKFGDGCASCHKSIEWLGLPDEVGRDAHDKTIYPLAGRHRSVACAACHPPQKPPAVRYRQLVFDRCGGCHADRHAGEFAKRDDGECGACHTVAGFMPTTFGFTQHATTQFALDGRHRAVACAGCHLGARPRLDLRVAKSACADCHANPHGDQFSAKMAQGGCAGCHATNDWHAPKIDHSTWPLTGAHGRTACAACHGEAAKNGSPADYRSLPRRCEGCHDDIHAGQFAMAGAARGCADCHGTDAFAIPTFDHATKARYPLAGKHGQVPCKSCHPTTELRNGTKAVRYRLGYRQCKACHANPHPGGRR